MVVQSAKTAAQMFKYHDGSFCDRISTDAFTSHGYKSGSLAVGSYGPYWRVLRRLCASELLVNKRINETESLRRKCVDEMIDWIEEAESCEVDVGKYLFLMAFNLVGNLMVSSDVVDPRSKEGKEFFDAMNKVAQWAGRVNIADVWPVLRWLDPQGIKRGMVRDLGRAAEIVAGFMRSRMAEKKQQQRSDEGKKDFLSTVLEFEGDAKEGIGSITQHNAVIIILEMFLAGSETTSVSIEWAMTELLRNPETMKKAKAELNEVIGPHRLVEEKDIEQLKYLQAVVKETLRLHPPVPLLLPRRALEDATYMGYHIPKGTQIFVNVWAIGRDPDVWADPLLFKPERFLSSNTDYKGQNYELIPFGSGRRICVGMMLAQRMLHLTLASLLHCFDWELESGVTPESIDMREREGITARKLVPLKAIPKKRFT